MYFIQNRKWNISSKILVILDLKNLGCSVLKCSLTAKYRINVYKKIVILWIKCQIMHVAVTLTVYSVTK